MYMGDVMAMELSDEQWKPIDEWILRRWIIDALKAIKAASGVGIAAALDVFHERYKMLRESRPGEFACEHEEYWKDFYS
jgi:hypothetical protein